MALADHQPTKSIHGPPCSVGVLLETLNTEDKAELTEWLTDPTIGADNIWKALAQAGHRVGRQSVGHHRAGRCRCGR